LNWSEILKFSTRDDRKLSSLQLFSPVLLKNNQLILIFHGFIDLTLLKEVRWLFLGHYWSPLKWDYYFWLTFNLFFSERYFLGCSWVLKSNLDFKSSLSISDLYYTGGPRYMQSFYLRFRVYEIEKWPFSGTYPLIYSNPWCFYMRIHYMRA